MEFSIKVINAIASVEMQDARLQNSHAGSPVFAPVLAQQLTEPAQQDSGPAQQFTGPA